MSDGLMTLFLRLLDEHPEELCKAARTKPVGELYCLWYDTAGPCPDGTYVKILMSRPWTPGSTSCARLEQADVDRICKEAQALVAKGGGLTHRELITSLGLADAFKSDLDWEKR